MPRPTRDMLGRHPSPVDTRDRNLSYYLPRRVAIQPKKWEFPHEPVDQGDHPYCTGAGVVDFGDNEPVPDKYGSVDIPRFYTLIKAKEGIKPGDPRFEEGGDVRTVASVMRDIGMIDGYAFAHDIQTISKWLSGQGPMVVGTPWLDSMFDPDENGMLTVAGIIDPYIGHCYVVNELRDDGCYGFQQSWGEWGLNGTGKFYMKISDFSLLFRNGGEAIAAVELAYPTVPAKSKSCSTIFLDYFRR